MANFYDTIASSSFIGTEEDDVFFFARGGVDTIQGRGGRNTLIFDQGNGSNPLAYIDLIGTADGYHGRLTGNYVPGSEIPSLDIQDIDEVILDVSFLYTHADVLVTPRAANAWVELDYGFRSAKIDLSNVPGTSVVANSNGIVNFEGGVVRSSYTTSIIFGDGRNVMTADGRLGVGATTINTDFGFFQCFRSYA